MWAVEVVCKWAVRRMHLLISSYALNEILDSGVRVDAVVVLGGVRAHLACQDVLHHHALVLADRLDEDDLCLCGLQLLDDPPALLHRRVRRVEDCHAAEVARQVEVTRRVEPVRRNLAHPIGEVGQRGLGRLVTLLHGFPVLVVEKVGGLHRAPGIQAAIVSDVENACRGTVKELDILRQPLCNVRLAACWETDHHTHNLVALGCIRWLRPEPCLRIWVALTRCCRGGRRRRRHRQRQRWGGSRRRVGALHAPGRLPSSSRVRAIAV